MSGIIGSAGSKSGVIGTEINPSQPSFYAYTGNQDNVLGAAAQLNPVVWPSTRWNNGGHYDTSTGRFTAPVTGKYFLGVHFNLRIGTGTVGSSAFNYMDMNLQSSNITHGMISYGAKYDHNGYDVIYDLTYLFDMDAGDTSQMFIAIAGGTQTIRLTSNSSFVGYLVH